METGTSTGAVRSVMSTDADRRAGEPADGHGRPACDGQPQPVGVGLICVWVVERDCVGEAAVRVAAAGFERHRVRRRRRAAPAAPSAICEACACPMNVTSPTSLPFTQHTDAMRGVPVGAGRHSLKRDSQLRVAGGAAVDVIERERQRSRRPGIVGIRDCWLRPHHRSEPVLRVAVAQRREIHAAILTPQSRREARGGAGTGDCAGATAMRRPGWAPSWSQYIRVSVYAVSVPAP